MGHRETSALAFVEWPLGYHPCDIGILTCAFESRRGTLLGVKDMHMELASNVDEALAMAFKIKGNDAKVAVIN